MATPVEAIPPAPPPVTPDDLPPIRWTFYIGGVFGMLMGFVLRVSYRPPETLLDEAIMAGVESVLWFASFALFEQIRWTRHLRALVLTGGVAALLINLLVSGGIGFPAVAGMMWIVIALALNALAPVAWHWPSGALLLRYVPLPIVASLALIYFVGVFLPVTSARHVMRLFMNAPTVSTAEKVFPASEKAVQTDDPDNVALNVDLAEIYGMRWETTVHGFGKGDQTADALWKKALAYAVLAQFHDPNGRAGYMEEYNLRIRFANTFASLEMEKQMGVLRVLLGKGSVQMALGSAARQLLDPRSWQPVNWIGSARKVDGDAAQFALGCVSPAVRSAPQTWRLFPWTNAQDTGPTSNLAMNREEHRLAADVLLKFLPNDPHNARLHYEIALSLFASEDRLELAEEHALRALALHAKATNSTRKLTDPQRKYLLRRLGLPPES
jgi:hypothetical protein